LIVLMIGFQLIKIEMMRNQARQARVYAVKALNISGVPFPRWSYTYFIQQATRSPAMMKYLIEKGMNINVPVRLNGSLTPARIGEITSTPLMTALTVGAVDTARLLIERGANVHARDSIGRSPMTIAVTYCPQAINLLLGAGVDINEQTRFGTPLLTAARY